MTFFSGTDLNTLKEEGADTNHFVSLIVNNAGVYTAAITRKVTSIAKGVRDLKYNTFNNEPVEDESEDFQYEDTCIEYYNLEIIKEVVPDTPKSELELRFLRLKESKSSYINRGFANSNFYSSDWSYKGSTYNKALDTQPKLFTDEEMGTIKKPEPKDTKVSSFYPYEDEEIAYDKDFMPKEIVDNTVVQIITGDIFAQYKGLDLDRWAKNMNALYSKRFGSNPKEDKDNHFSFWAEVFVDFLEEELPETALDKKGFDYRDAIWAYDVIKRLEKYYEKYPENQYLEIFINTLERMLI